MLTVGLVSHFVPERAFARCGNLFVRSPALAQGVLLFAAAWVLRSMSGAESVPFVYFQF